MAEVVSAASDEICVAGISAGSSHSAVLLSNGAVVSFGRGEDGQLGHGDADERTTPARVAILSDADIDTVVCGAEFSMGVSRSNKEVYSWGWGDFGRLGHGHCNDVFSPQIVAFFSGMPIAQIACGDTHSFAITTSGELYSFGRNQNGQLGLGHNNDVTTPTRVAELSDRKVVSVSCGAEHSAMATESGKVYSCGWGRYGNLGDGHCEDRWVPVQVQGLEGHKAVSVACGWRHSAALTDKGTIFTFGWSKYGQLGHGDHRDRVTAAEVRAFEGKVMTGVAGGWRHTMAVDEEGVLYAWGWNKFGQLGVGDNEDRSAPTAVAALKGQPVARLACGWRHSIAVTTTGAVYTWGRGVNGQLGHSAAVDRSTPTQLTALSKGYIQISDLDAAASTATMAVPVPDRYALVPGSADPAPTPAAVPTVPETKRRRVDAGLVPGHFGPAN